MADYQSNYQSGNQQGGANINNVNSNSIALFGSDSTMLRVSFKNESLILTIIPRIVDENGKARWPRELSHSAMLRANVCAGLYQGLMDEYLDCIEKKEDYPGHAVVPLNRDATNLCGFAYVGGKPSFSIFMNVGSDRSCTEIYTFPFEATTFITHYNPTTGMYEVQEEHGQLYVVMELLASVAKHMSGTIAHSSKVNSSFNTNQIISYVRAIATKLGATPSPYGNFSGAYEGGNAFNNSGMDGANGSMTWSSGANHARVAGMTPIPEIKQLESLDALMGGSPQ